jgi:hypothetical protein
MRRRSQALRHFLAYLDADQVFGASRVTEFGWPTAPHPDRFLPAVWEYYLRESKVKRRQ